MSGDNAISVVMTIYNESGGVDRFFDGLHEWTRLPDEIVIVDGGSTDDTVERIRHRTNDAPAPVNLVAEGHCNISEGRNRAIQAARHDILAVTDLGCRIDPHWLERITEPFRQDPSVDVVAGYYDFVREHPIQAAYADLRHQKKLSKANFIPSSRSIAYRRKVWEAVGGYPENMTVGEDTYFDLRIREHGFKEVIEPSALVYWEVNKTYRSLFRKYFRYAHSNGARFQLPLMYGFYIVNYFLFVVWLVLAAILSPWFLTPFVLHVAAYLVLRIFRREPVRKNLSLAAAGRYLAVMLTIDTATVCGYLSGLPKYLTGRGEPWTPPAH